MLARLRALGASANSASTPVQLALVIAPLALTAVVVGALALGSDEASPPPEVASATFASDLAQSLGTDPTELTAPASSRRSV